MIECAASRKMSHRLNGTTKNGRNADADGDLPDDRCVEGSPLLATGHGSRSLALDWFGVKDTQDGIRAKRQTLARMSAVGRQRRNMVDVSWAFFIFIRKSRLYCIVFFSFLR